MIIIMIKNKYYDNSNDINDNDNNNSNYDNNKNNNSMTIMVIKMIAIINKNIITFTQVWFLLLYG